MDLRWIEFCVPAAEAQQDRLLSSAFAPVLEDARQRGWVQRGYFLRERMPSQLRLRMEAQCGSLEELHARLSEALRSNGAEGSSPPESAAPELLEIKGLLAGPQVQELLHGVFNDTSPMLLQQIAQIGGNHSARLTIAFDLMVAQCYAVDRILFHRTGSSYPTSFLSLRSHADGFFIMSRSPKESKRALDAYCDPMLVSLIGQLRRLHTQLAEDGDHVSSTAAHWINMIETYCDRIRYAVLASPELTQGAVDTEYLGDYHDISISPFHEAIQNSPAYLRRMRTDPQFQALRVLFTLLYWTLQNLGLRLMHRYLLCHATALAFEKAFDVDPAAAIRALVGPQTGFATGEKFEC